MNAKVSVFVICVEGEQDNCPLDNCPQDNCPPDNWPHDKDNWCSNYCPAK